MTAPDLSIVVPCYNERENIPLLCRDFTAKYPESNAVAVELIIVDNGSSDGSAEIISNCMAEDKRIRSVRVEVNQGYGYGLTQGLNAAKGKFVGWTHGDMQTDIGDLGKAYKAATQAKNPRQVFVKGFRKNREFSKLIIAKCMAMIVSLIWRGRYQDINAQPNLFERSSFDDWGQAPKDAAIELFAYYRAVHSGFNVIRIPVEMPERLHGQSKMNRTLADKWKQAVSTIRNCLKIKREFRKAGRSPV